MMKTICNFQFTIFNLKTKQKGFTLVELLASVIVLVAVGSVIAGIISSSLRGANKTNSIENIRQNGNYALAQMSKDIEYAQTLDGSNTGFNFNIDNDPKYLTSCSPPSMTLNDIAVRSASNDSIVIRYTCNSAILSANGTPLIDATSVSLISCSLSCIQAKVTDIPIIKISFSIGPKNPNNLAENSTPPIVFETSVAMRNYKK